MIALHIITDNRNDDAEATAPDTFRKLYGLGKGKRPGVAARGALRRQVSEALPLLWKSAAPVVFID